MRQGPGDGAQSGGREAVVHHGGAGEVRTGGAAVAARRLIAMAA
ncbi:hypothetical protein ACQP2K_35015 [Microbispora siamensis]